MNTAKLTHGGKYNKTNRVKSNWTCSFVVQCLFFNDVSLICVKLCLYIYTVDKMDDFGSGNESFKALWEYGSDKELAEVELFQFYPEALLVFASVCCGIFMLIGIPGNLLTIIALAKCKKVRNATAIFIINLSLSDLLFCCFILPLAASSFWNHAWKEGKVLCLMFPLARYALVAVSLFSVLFIAINRYIMITHPRLYPKIYTNRNIYIMIAGIWIVSFGALLPTCLEVWGRFSLNPVTGSCTIMPDENGNSPKKFLFIAAFILPSVVIIVCYARVLWVVRKTAIQTRRPTFRPAQVRSLSITTIGKSIDLDHNRVGPTHPHHLSVACLPQTELSSATDSSSETQQRKSMPEIKLRTLNNEPVGFRQSFMASMRWQTGLMRPRLPTKKDKRLLTMIIAIMLSFCICHLPITLTKTIFLEFTPHPLANIIGYVLIYFTTCVNPIIYVVMSNEYRQAYKNLIKCTQQSLSVCRQNYKMWTMIANFENFAS